MKTARNRYQSMVGLLDEFRISAGAPRGMDLCRPEWCGFLPGTYEKCRTNLPLELYFSKPLDTARGAPVRLMDITAGKPVPCKGTWLGDKSVYEMRLPAPLALDHEFELQFEKGKKQAGDKHGNLLVVEKIPPQRFRTRKRGEMPRALPLKFRNDNSHVTVEGMERMCANGTDMIEFNLVQIKDGWISNHMTRMTRNGKTFLRVIEGANGDRAGYEAITTDCDETPYATYAAVDYIDKTDGKIHSLPRAEKLYEVIRKWDKPVHLQIISSDKEDRESVKAFLKRINFDWTRFHAWHGDCRRDAPSYARNSIFVLAYPWRRLQRRSGWAWQATQEHWPGYTNPQWVRQAKRNGRTVWVYGGEVLRSARLGCDYRMDNSLAYHGNMACRKELYKLHEYENAVGPAVKSVTCNNKPLEKAAVSARPAIAVCFSLPVEARSFNYDTVRLTPAGSEKDNAARIPLRIDGDTGMEIFRISPQQNLRQGDYVLTIGHEKGPVSLAGKRMSPAYSVSFSVGQ